jgi:hypothetical protein
MTKREQRRNIPKVATVEFSVGNVAWCIEDDTGKPAPDLDEAQRWLDKHAIDLATAMHGAGLAYIRKNWGKARRK